MEFKVLNTLAELQDIKSAYQELLNRIKDYEIFYSYEWLESYIKFSPDFKNSHCKLSIITGYINKRLVLFCPFAFLEKKLVFITQSATDYNSILIDESLNCFQSLKDLVDFIEIELKPSEIFLKKYKMQDSLLNLYSVLSEKKLKTGCHYKAFLSQVEPAPYCYLSDENKYVKKQINDIKRREKRLAEKYKISFSHEKKLTEEDLAFITEIKDKQFGNTIFHKRKYWDFFLALSENENIRGGY